MIGSEIPISLAMGPANEPQLVYWNPDGLRYAPRSLGLGWQIETLDPSPEPPAGAALVVGADGTPHVAYMDESRGELRYALRETASWTTETLSRAAYGGGYVPLALDEAGNPRIAYYDGASNDLKYFARPLEPVILAVEPGGRRRHVSRSRARGRTRSAPERRCDFASSCRWRIASPSDCSTFAGDGSPGWRSSRCQRVRTNSAGVRAGSIRGSTSCRYGPCVAARGPRGSCRFDGSEGVRLALAPVTAINCL